MRKRGFDFFYPQEAIQGSKVKELKKSHSLVSSNWSWHKKLNRCERVRKN